MADPNDGPKFEWTRLPVSQKRGPKACKCLRHDIKRLFHELYEKASLLRQVDESFEEELKRLGLDKVMTTIAKAAAADKAELKERRPRHAE